MESIFNFICIHANDAYWILFFLLLLAGMNIPISEDLILLTGGALGSACLHSTSEVWHLYLWLYLGSWVSAWEAYWLGRTLGPRLYDIKWFSRFITPSRIAKLHHYYERFGIFTFIIGRFIPGGVRNALFMTSGLGKMPFLRFIIRDGIACLLSSSLIFYIGYKFGQNYSLLVKYLKKYELTAGLFVISVILLLVYLVLRKRKIDGT